MLFLVVRHRRVQNSICEQIECVWMKEKNHPADYLIGWRIFVYYSSAEDLVNTGFNHTEHEHWRLIHRDSFFFIASSNELFRAQISTSINADNRSTFITLAQSWNSCGKIQTHNHKTCLFLLFLWHKSSGAGKVQKTHDFNSDNYWNSIYSFDQRVQWFE